MEEMIYYVAVYLQSQKYGGPEEGGWYYCTGMLVKDKSTYDAIGILPSSHLSIESALTAKSIMDEAIEKAGLNKDRPGFSSVLSEGRYRAEVREGSVPEFYPTRRPHYE